MGQEQISSLEQASDAVGPAYLAGHCRLQSRLPAVMVADQPSFDNAAARRRTWRRFHLALPFPPGDGYNLPVLSAPCRQ